MENKTAIMILKNISHRADIHGDENNALKMAIAALEKEPSVTIGTYEQVRWERDIAIGQLEELGYGFAEKIDKCEDAISRNDMLDAVGHGTTYTSEEVQKIIMQLPSVVRENRTGHWTHDGGHWKNRWICSECGYKLFDEQTNYCPNCGNYNEGEG